MNIFNSILVPCLSHFEIIILKVTIIVFLYPLYFNIFAYFFYLHCLKMHVGGSLISKRDLIVGLFFNFSKKELTLNRTLRACLSKRELFQMIIPSKIYALCYDISQETELKKETCVENCNHWL